MLPRGLRTLLLLLMLALSPPLRAQGATPGTASPEASRPRVALVLSGGGARGFAHVGVLRALAALHVPIDLVAGVSMGAVVGGAYAAGRSVPELEQFVRDTDWANIIADRPPRDDLAFRRREDDLLLPSRIEFGISPTGVQLPPSTAGSAALETALRRLLPAGSSQRPVNQLALPFRSVASDLLSGELVLLDDTPLFMSLRASLSVPGVFAPVRVNRRLLIDGGLVRNLPVDIARAMGADVVIAVNVGTPLSGEAELGSALGVAQQMLHILTEQNVQRSLKELGPQDVLIAPDLSGHGFMDFSHSARAIAAGERATLALAERLRPLAVSAQAYAAIESARTATTLAGDAALPLASRVVQPTAHAGSAALTALLDLKPGEPASGAQIDQAATRLFGRGEFARVEVDVTDSGGQRSVTVTPVEAEWARSKLRVGLEVVSDFSDDHRFTISAMHVLSWVNTWGAELRSLARIGSERLLYSQLLQPLAPGSPWYVAPSLQYRASAIDVYDQGRRSLRVGFELGTASLVVGRRLSNFGNVQLGLERRRGHGRSLVGDSLPASDDALRETATYLQLQFDTLDSLALPSRGGLLLARAERSANRGAGAGHATASVESLVAFRVDDWVGHVYGEWARARRGLAPLSLGGFLRLSGTPRESLGGGSVQFGRLVMARHIGDMPTGLGGAVRAGFSLEAGGSHDPGESLRWRGLKQAGSAFVAIDTRFGPVFLALGGTRGAGGTLYLFLGPFW